jgi:hypothetical protein
MELFALNQEDFSIFEKMKDRRPNLSLQGLSNKIVEPFQKKKTTKKTIPVKVVFMGKHKIQVYTPE